MTLNPTPTLIGKSRTTPQPSLVFAVGAPFVFYLLSLGDVSATHSAALVVGGDSGNTVMRQVRRPRLLRTREAPDDNELVALHSYVKCHRGHAK